MPPQVLQVAVLASGRGSNLDALLASIRAGLVAAQVTAVVSDKPDAPVLALARRHGVPHVVSLPPLAGEKRDAYDVRLAGTLGACKPDLVVLAGYMRIVGPKVCAAFPDRIVNIHPSLLPAFKGLKAIRQALEAGVAFAGCTTHLVTGDLDGGPILLQAALCIRPGESEEELSRRVLRLEHLVLPRTVQLFAEGRIQRHGPGAPGPRDAANASLRIAIAPGPTWLGDARVNLAAGALYGEGF